MSQEYPTPEELSEIEQFQNGAYGAEPPEWWFDRRAFAVPPRFQWGVEFRGVTIYESEAEARRQLNLAQMDVPAVLVKREIGAWAKPSGNSSANGSTTERQPMTNPMIPAQAVEAEASDWATTLDLLKACAKTWPERPQLESFEWPFSRAALERCIDDAMEYYGRVVAKSDPR